jgi:mannose/cellobiose epimerase-like protein (N-acyl-D-glucosamine 2-epimerase family)
MLGFDHGWDPLHGGVMYAYDLEGHFCDTDKYFWPQSEGFAAAALLYQATGRRGYHFLLWCRSLLMAASRQATVLGTLQSTMAVLLGPFC